MRTVVVTILSACAVPLLAVELGTPFSNGAVLQRGTKVPVWGTADAGATVRVTFADQVKTAKAGEDGAWRVDLDPMPACAEGRTLTVREQRVEGRGLRVEVDPSNSQTSLSDILVGEVWFCAGQSNCECTLWGENPHFRDAKGATRMQLTRMPLVRFYRTPRAHDENPLAKLKESGRWQKFLPEADLGEVTAMGAYFAFELHQALGIPIGIVQSLWGGTPIMAWMRADAFEANAYARQMRTTVATGPTTEPKCHPSRLWNAMVAPWVPMAMRGLIWYQGEADCGMGLNYAKMLHALYDGWKQAFENDHLRILVAQVAPHAYGGTGCPALQEGQQLFAAEEPNAEIAVICDRGNLDDYHPADKEALGQRLALLALRYDYGFTGIKARSPTVKRAEAVGDMVTLSFADAEGLYLYNADWTVANGFEIAGSDGLFKPCEIVNFKVAGYKPYANVGTLSGDKVVLRAEGVDRPKRVRYLHARPWTGNLFNEVGLPLGPFQTDVK